VTCTSPDTPCKRRFSSARTTYGTTKPVGHEIVRRARDPGLAGATILRGSEGLGTSALIHTQRILSLAGDLPLVVIIVDAEDKVRDFLPELDDLMSEGMVVLDDVQVVH
jgi:PII-like signaling protein